MFQQNDPRPQSVLSIHSSLSNPDCSTHSKERASENGVDRDDASSTFEDPLDEHVNSVRSNDASGAIAEELLLQTKLKDLRTKKEEMLNLVKELQNMNKDSDLRRQVK